MKTTPPGCGAGRCNALRMALVALLSGAILALFLAAGGQQVSAAASAQAQFELNANAPFEMEARCPRQLMLIHWRTGREQNVDLFRVHRRAVGDGDGDSEGGEWLNSAPLVAQEDNSSYTVVDAQAGQEVLYTLYGFVAAEGYEEPVYLLSEAQAVELGGPVQATCVFLPITTDYQ